MSRSVSAPSSVTKTSPCWKGFIVPGSTFRYGSSFCIVTDRPRARRRWPRLEAVSPLPSEDATPPVTKMCLVVLDEPGNREFTREFDRCTTGFELIINSAFHAFFAGIPLRLLSSGLRQELGVVQQLLGVGPGGIRVFLARQHA